MTFLDQEQKQNYGQEKLDRKIWKKIEEKSKNKFLGSES